MPELPEVEGYRKYIEGTCQGQRIASFEVQDAKVLESPAAEFEELLRDNVIKDTDRIGKYLFLILGHGGVLVMHFGMTGSPRFYMEAEDAPRHPRATFHFETGFALAFNCPRKFGRLSLTGSIKEFAQSRKLGPDAAEISPEEFYLRIGGRKAPIKSALMNQKILAGVGNWIADEVLYQAEIHPTVRVADLMPDQLERIHEKMDYVLRVAIGADAHIASFPEHFMVHSRWTDQGRPDAPKIELETMKVGGRTTYFDPTKQKI